MYRWWELLALSGAPRDPWGELLMIRRLMNRERQDATDGPNPWEELSGNHDRPKALTSAA